MSDYFLNTSPCSLACITAATSLPFQPFSYSFNLSPHIPSILSPLWTLAPLICCLSTPRPRRGPATIPPLCLYAPTPIPSTSPTLPFLHLAIFLFPKLSFYLFLLHLVRTMYIVSGNLHTQSPYVCLHLSSLTSLYFTSLSLRASRECQNKERLLEQRFRAALRDFQQWLVNAKISTAKCFDVPQSVAEASTALQRIQVWDILFYNSKVNNCWVHKNCNCVTMEFWHCSCLKSLKNHTFSPSPA